MDDRPVRASLGTEQPDSRLTVRRPQALRIRQSRRNATIREFRHHHPRVPAPPSETSGTTIRDFRHHHPRVPAPPSESSGTTIRDFRHHHPRVPAPPSESSGTTIRDSRHRHGRLRGPLCQAACVGRDVKNSGDGGFRAARVGMAPRVWAGEHNHVRKQRSSAPVRRNHLEGRCVTAVVHVPRQRTPPEGSDPQSGCAAGSDRGAGTLGSWCRNSRIVVPKPSDRRAGTLGSSCQNSRIVVPKLSDRGAKTLGSSYQNSRIVVPELSDRRTKTLGSWCQNSRMVGR